MRSSTDYRYDTAGGPLDRSLRVGDKERDAVGEVLRQRHLEGRLDTDELQDRLERCMAAKTYAELDDLVSDFPYEGGERRFGGRPYAWRPWPRAFLIVPLVLIGASIAGGHLAWPVAFVLFFCFVRPLAWRAWGGGYGRGFSAVGPRRTTRA